MSQAFERACEAHRANIANLRFHDLPHEAISRLFDRTIILPDREIITSPKASFLGPKMNEILTFWLIFHTFGTMILPFR